MSAEANTDRVVDLTQQLDRLRGEVDDMQAGSGTALVPAGQNAGEARKGLIRQRAAIEEKNAEIQRVADELKAEMGRRVREAKELMAPLREQMARLQEGIWMVNLYLGTEEEIVQLLDGEPAPVDEQVVVRQLVLAMDEECAAFAEDGGIDSLEIEEFDRWLAEDPAHLHQVIPEPKAVVALVPRWENKRYENPWQGLAAAEGNAKTYFLIRNGDRVWRVVTDFYVGKTLVPAREEFTEFFYTETGWGKDRRKRALVPGTREWERAEEEADGRRRHYMRVGLILQGLVDRTHVFRPAPPTLSFLQGGEYVRFVMDADLTIGTGREAFRDWQKRLNAELRPGMRLVGSFGYWAFDREEHRVHPRGADYPPSETPLRIEEVKKHRGGEGFVVRYERSGEVYDPKMWVETRPGWGYRGGYRKPKQRASCVLYPEDRFIIPFDLAEVDDMRAFLHSRLDRHEYTSMFPLLKAAIRAKLAEEEAEAPFRELLANLLAREHGVSPEEAAAAVPDLVRWYKFANRHHRPLVAGDSPDLVVDEKTGLDQAKAVRLIVAEFGQRLADRDRPVKAALVAELRDKHPTAVCIARKRDGAYLVLEPMNDHDVWVREYEYGARGALRETREWRLVGPRAERWTIAWSTERWEAWDRMADRRDHLTDPEVDELVERVRGEVGVLSRATGETLSVAYRADARKFYVVELAEPAVLPEDPFEWPTQAKTQTFKATWKRTRDGISLAVNGWPSSYVYDDDRMLAPRGGNIVYRDTARIAHVDRYTSRYTDRRRATERLWDRVRRLEDAVEAEWLARARQERHAAFMAEYGDESIYEGWLKSQPDLEYPYRRHDDDFLLDDAIAAVIAAGGDPEGMTVAAVAARAAALDVDWKAPDDLADITLPARDEARELELA